MLARYVFKAPPAPWHADIGVEKLQPALARRHGCRMPWGCRTPWGMAAALRLRRHCSRAASNTAAVPSDAAEPSLRPAVGIDLGTSSSAVALVDAAGRAYVVVDSDGKAVVPSAVHVKQVRAHACVSR
eukprot:365308-Chlamydomonas_euryale.AAC.8